MDKRCKIYLPLDWMYGDATAFYVDIIADAMKVKGYETSIVKNVDEIDSNDVVLTVASYNVKEVMIRKPLKVLNWYQGITPEEYWYFLHKKEESFLNRLIKYLRFSKSDYYALRHCSMNFFVSETMLQFYRKKFCYLGKKNFIMPCFNQNLHKEAFVDKKYKSPTFVYAGSMDGWQCFDETVDTFVKIKKRIPQATLTVLTAAQDIARDVLNKYGIDAEIKYVSHDKVDEELRKYKYGFIIRGNNPVNRVATPTKLNSYMANGIIPVYTDVIGAFKGRISGLKYSVPLTVKGEGLMKLFELEKTIIASADVLEDYRHLFDTYYSRELYVEKIAKLKIQ